MGISISSLLSRLWGTRELRIIMLGLDAAGKTTILYKMKLGEVITTIPTIGFNVETIKFKNISFTVWDVGGQKRIRALWKYYFQNTDAVIFVVDSQDVERLDEAKEELEALLSTDELRDAALLVFANKQDMPGAISVQDVIKRLDLSSHRRQWFVMGSDARTGVGLVEGLDWLSSTLQQRSSYR